MSRLHVERIETEAALISITAEWRKLEALQYPRVPFKSPEWTLAWWTHIRERNLNVRDHLYIRVVRDENGVLIGVAPLMRRDRPAVGPLCMRMVQFLGGDPYINEIRGPVCSPDDEKRVTRAIFEELHRNRQEWDWLIWSGSSDIQAISSEFSGLKYIEGTANTHDFLLQLPSTWEEFRSGLKHNVKESVRKCYNSLKRDNLSSILKVVNTSAEIPIAIDHFFRLHSARSELTDTIKHRDVFAEPKTTAFLEDVCLQLAEQNTHIFLLEVAGKVVATRVGFLFGNDLYLYFSGFDPEFGKYSVMTTTVAEIIKWAISNDVKCVNLSTGHDISKTRWGPQEIVFYGTKIQSNSLHGKLAYITYTKTLTLKNKIRDWWLATKTKSSKTKFSKKEPD